MNLNYIRANFRSFKLATLDGWGDPLAKCVEALYRNYIQDSGDDVLAAIVKDLPLEVYTVFDLYLGDDTRAEMHVVVFGGAPVAVAYRSQGDSSYDYDIIDADAYRQLGRELAARMLDQRLAKETATSGDSVRHLKESGLTFVGPSRSAFVIQAPRDAFYTGSDLWKNHRVFYPQDDGSLVPVTKFVGFAQPKTAGYRSNPGDDDVRVEIDGKEVVVDGCRLVFEMLPGQIDAKGLQEHFAHPGGWFLESAFDHNRSAFVLTSVPKSWLSKTVMVQFESLEELRRFRDTYPEEVFQEGGPFRFEGLGFDGVLTEI